MTLREVVAKCDETSRQRYAERVSTSTKLSATNRATPSFVTHLINKGISMEKALSRVMDKKGEQKQQHYRVVCGLIKLVLSLFLAVLLSFMLCCAVLCESAGFSLICASEW